MRMEHDRGESHKIEHDEPRDAAPGGAERNADTSQPGDVRVTHAEDENPAASHLVNEGGELTPE